ncbi:hypothetical protein AVEN_103527-1, partial [Araneus ventricosus]
ESISKVEMASKRIENHSQIVNIWIETSKLTCSLNGKSVKKLNERIHQLKVPSETVRCLRSTKDSLLSNSVSSKDVSDAERSFKKFVTGVKEIYGVQELSYNMYLLLHMPKAVSTWGPLWAHSCFIFENSLGKLKKFHHGTKGVPTQILSTCLYKSILKTAVLSLEKVSHSNVKNFINNMDSGHSLTKKVLYAGKSIFLGNGKQKKLFRVSEQSLLKLINKQSLAEVSVYERLLYEGKIYTSNSIHFKRNDYIIMISGGTCIEIDEILTHDNEVFFLIWKKLQVKNFQRSDKTLGNLCKHILVVQEEDDDIVDHSSILDF